MGLDAFTADDVVRHAESALLRSGAAGVYPTPLKEVAAASADVRDVVDMSALPDELNAKRPRALSRLLGVITMRRRTVYIVNDQGEPRRHWTLAHETSHGLLPWHRALAYFDDHHNLFRHAEEALEQEANHCAAHLIFQGHRFVERAADYRLGLATPVALSQDVGASIHATIRYYTETHPRPVALLITGHLPHFNGHVPVWLATESPSFRARFGPISNRFDTRGLPYTTGSVAFPDLPDAVRASRLGTAPKLAEGHLRELSGANRTIRIETFFNGRCHFVMFTPTAARNRLRRGVILRAG